MASAQGLSGFERDRALTMLNNIKGELQKSTTTTDYHGMDVDARFKAAEDKIKTAATLGPPSASSRRP
jgi:hypothetical protein